MSSENKMLTGAPGKTLLLFALPLLAGNLLQQLYSVIDSVIVGHFVSSNALGAIGVNFSLVFLITCVSYGLANGTSILIGQFIGAGKSSKIRGTITTSLIYAGVISIIVALAGLVSVSWILSAMNTPDALFADSLIYMQIYLIGLPFTFGFNMLSGIFRSFGDAKKPLYFLGIASIVNIALDLLFVISFDWGVAGVAIATVIAQAVALAFQLVMLMFKMREFRAEEKAKLVDMQILKSLLKLALPTTAQETLIAVGMMITQTMVNGFGEYVVSGYSIGDKIVTFAMLPVMNIGIGLTVLTAQNIGAKMPDRAKEGFKSAIKYSLIFMAFMIVLVGVFSKELISLFVGADATAELFAAGQSYLYVNLVNFILIALIFPCEAILKGSGDVNVFFIFALTGAIIKIILALILIPFIGYLGIWLAILIGWTTETILAYLRYRSGKWRYKSVV